MESKIMQVYFGNDCLPYKDSARSVHYPMVGRSFSGASLATNVHFYTKYIGGNTGMTWVAVAKLPNGKMLYKVLTEYDNSTEEPYVDLPITSEYTALSGDVYIALNGFAGNVTVTLNTDTGLYSVVGNPIVQATGVLKLTIGYSPSMPESYNPVDEITVQEALALVADRVTLEELNTILTNNVSVLFDVDNLIAEGETSVDLTDAQRNLLRVNVSAVKYKRDVYLKLRQTDNSIHFVNLEHQYQTSGSTTNVYYKAFTLSNNTLTYTTYSIGNRYSDSQLNTLLAGKVDKVLDANKVYGTSNTSTQTSFPVDYGTNYGGNVVRRDSNSQINVPQTPTSPTHATSMGYVESRIEDIEMRSDVTDIVGTYAELQAYDTSSLRDNDIVKVLTDSTHDNASSYYRWVITNSVGAWEYVGSEGPYVTPSQMQTYVTSVDSNVVHKTGRETIAGVKTFTSNCNFASVSTPLLYLENENGDSQPNVYGDSTYGLSIWQEETSGSPYIDLSNGEITIHAGGNDAIKVEDTIDVAYDVVPTTNNTQDLGATSHNWKDIYFNGKLIDSTGATNGLTLAQIRGIMDTANGRCKTYVLWYEDTVEQIKTELSQGDITVVNENGVDITEAVLNGDYDNIEVLNQYFDDDADVINENWNGYFIFLTSNGYTFFRWQTGDESIKVGDIILVVEQGVPDRWFGGNSGPITGYFYALEAKTNLAAYYTKTQTDLLLNAKVDKTTTIATLPLSANIDAQALTDKLMFMDNTNDLDYVMGDE